MSSRTPWRPSHRESEKTSRVPRRTPRSDGSRHPTSTSRSGSSAKFESHASSRWSPSLTPPLDARSFTLRIGGGGAFPPTGAPRAIWLGLATGREGLIAVHEQLRGRLVPLGFAPEARPYSPHLTIARVKEARPRDARAMRDLLGKWRPMSASVRSGVPHSSSVGRRGPGPSTSLSVEFSWLARATDHTDNTDRAYEIASSFSPWCPAVR